MNKTKYAAAGKTLALVFFSSFLLSPSAVFSAEDCQKNADACAADGRKKLPFLEAAAAAETKAAAAPAPKARKESRPPAAAPEPAASTAAAAGAPLRQAGDNGFSSPAWLLFVGAAIAGLYFYLRGTSRRGKKR